MGIFLLRTLSSDHLVICSHLRSLKGYDEPEILPSSTHPICLMSADGGQSCFSLKVVSCRRQAPTHAGIFFSAAGWLMMGRIKSSARRRRPRRKISATSLPSHITPIVKPNIRDSTTTPELGSQ
jgi:hypothetical protein